MNEYVVEPAALMNTDQWSNLLANHNPWLKDYPHILIPLMLGVGAALIAVGSIAIRIHIFGNRPSRLLPKISVLIFVVAAGIFLVVFALWIFALVYVLA